MINGLKLLRQIKKNTQDRLSFFTGIYDIIYKSGSMGSGVVLPESKLLGRNIISMGNKRVQSFIPLFFRES